LEQAANVKLIENEHKYHPDSLSYRHWILYC